MPSHIPRFTLLLVIVFNIATLFTSIGIPGYGVMAMDVDGTTGGLFLGNDEKNKQQKIKPKYLQSPSTSSIPRLLLADEKTTKPSSSSSSSSLSKEKYEQKNIQTKRTKAGLDDASAFAASTFSILRPQISGPPLTQNKNRNYPLSQPQQNFSFRRPLITTSNSVPPLNRNHLSAPVKPLQAPQLIFPPLDNNNNNANQPQSPTNRLSDIQKLLSQQKEDGDGIPNQTDPLLLLPPFIQDEPFESLAIDQKEKYLSSHPIELTVSSASSSSSNSISSLSTSKVQKQQEINTDNEGKAGTSAKGIESHKIDSSLSSSLGLEEGRIEEDGENPLLKSHPLDDDTFSEDTDFENINEEIKSSEQSTGNGENDADKTFHVGVETEEDSRQGTSNESSSRLKSLKEEEEMRTSFNTTSLDLEKKSDSNSKVSVSKDAGITSTSDNKCNSEEEESETDSIGQFLAIQPLSSESSTILSITNDDINGQEEKGGLKSDFGVSSEIKESGIVSRYLEEEIKKDQEMIPDIANGSFPDNVSGKNKAFKEPQVEETGIDSSKRVNDEELEEDPIHSKSLERMSDKVDVTEKPITSTQEKILEDMSESMVSGFSNSRDQDQLNQMPPIMNSKDNQHSMLGINSDKKDANSAMESDTDQRNSETDDDDTEKAIVLSDNDYDSDGIPFGRPMIDIGRPLLSSLPTQPPIIDRIVSSPHHSPEQQVSGGNGGHHGSSGGHNNGDARDPFGDSQLDEEEGDMDSSDDEDTFTSNLYKKPFSASFDYKQNKETSLADSLPGQDDDNKNNGDGDNYDDKEYNGYSFGRPYPPSRFPGSSFKPTVSHRDDNSDDDDDYTFDTNDDDDHQDNRGQGYGLNQHGSYSYRTASSFGSLKHGDSSSFLSPQSFSNEFKNTNSHYYDKHHVSTSTSSSNDTDNETFEKISHLNDIENSTINDASKWVTMNLLLISVATFINIVNIWF